MILTKLLGRVTDKTHKYVQTSISFNSFYNSPLKNKLMVPLCQGDINEDKINEMKANSKVAGNL